MAEGEQPSVGMGTPGATSEPSSMLPASGVNEAGTSKGNMKPVSKGEETWLASLLSNQSWRLRRERDEPYVYMQTSSSKGNWILSVFDDPNIVKKSGDEEFSFSLPEDPTILVREPSKLSYHTEDILIEEALALDWYFILERQDVKDLLQMVRGPNFTADIGETVEKLQEVLKTEDGTFKDVDTRFELYSIVFIVALKLEGVLVNRKLDDYYNREEMMEIIQDRIGRRIRIEATLPPGSRMWLWMDKLDQYQRKVLQDLIVIFLDDHDAARDRYSGMDWILYGPPRTRTGVISALGGFSLLQEYISQYLLSNECIDFMQQLTDESDNDKMEKARETLQWHVEGIRIKYPFSFQEVIAVDDILVSGVKCRAWIYSLIVQERHDRCNMEPFIRNKCLHDFKRQVLDNDWEEACTVNIQELFGGKDQIKTPITHDCLLTWAFITNNNDLIRCIMLCKPTRPFTPKDNSLIEKWKRILWLAAAQGKELLVEQLLAWDDIDTLINESPLLSALHVAVSNGNTRVVELLCKNKYAVRQVHEEDYEHRTPLKIATVNKDKETIKLLMGMDEVAKRVEQLYRDRQVYVDAANAILVGAALIASVTFAGWLQPPTGYDQTYIAIQGKPSIEAFVIFNSLAFFLAIAAVLSGADTAFFSRDEYIGDSVESMRLSLKLTTYLLICAVICVLGAFASAGIAILPPIRRYKWSMIVTIGVGITICGVMIIKITVRSSSRLTEWIKVPYHYLKSRGLKLGHFIHAGLQKHRDHSCCCSS